MKRFLTLASLFAAAVTASATNVNFTSFSPTDTCVSTVTAGGLNFNGGFCTAVWTGNPNDANAALISSTGLEADNGGSPFTLNDLDLTISWYNGDASDTVTVDGDVFGGGTDSTTLTLGQGLQEYDLEWTNLTSFSISSLGDGGYWALDNLDVNGTSPVPEPGTWLMMGTGLLGLALIAFRRTSARRRLTVGNLA